MTTETKDKDGSALPESDGSVCQEYDKLLRIAEELEKTENFWRDKEDDSYGINLAVCMAVNQVRLAVLSAIVEDSPNAAREPRAQQPCVACDGRGTVGEMELYNRPIRVTCSHCFGTGKEGGDHIRFANAVYPEKTQE